jgi:hypothetical protein
MLIVAIMVATITIAIIIFVGPKLVPIMSPGGGPDPKASTAVTDQPISQSVESAAAPVVDEPAAASGADEKSDGPAEEQEEAEPEFAEGDVRQAMCEEYAKRYLKARTGVDLIRAVQLSQAASCGWNAMLHADAATHDFVPGALKVAQEMQADDVPTEAGTSADSIEKIDRMADRIGDLDRKVDELRYRVR